jgi:hypothetical protein
MSWKNGTLATRSQIRRKSRRRVSSANPVARMPAHKVKDENAADHDRTGQDAPGRSLRNDVAIAGGCQVTIAHEIEHTGERPDKVANAADRNGPGEPRAPFTAVSGAGSFQCPGQPKHVFGKEEPADDLERAIERSGPGQPPFCDCIGEHDGDAGRDHRMVNAAKHPRGSVGGLRLKELIEPLVTHA